MRDELIVLVRIGLFILAGRGVAGGWLPDDVAAQLTDPAVVELVAGALLGLVSLIWYWQSRARKALRGVL